MADYRALSIGIDHLPTPICLRLQRQNSRSVAPIQCPPLTTAIVNIADSDVIWSDSFSGDLYGVTILKEDLPIFQCLPNQNRCNFSFTP